MTFKRHLKGVLIFSSRMELRDVMRSALKRSKLPDCEVVVPPSVERLTEEMERNDRYLLILDWEAGSQKVEKILKKAQKNFTVETRPILLIARQAENRLLAAGYEYHVSRVYSGDISLDRLRDLFEDIGRDEALNGPLRSVISSVNQKRHAGDWVGASKILDQVQKQVPDNQCILAEIAENHVQNAHWQEALNILSPLENLDPPYLRALNILGRCYMKLGQLDQAEEVLKKGKVTNPFNTDRLVMLGQCLLKLDKVQEAKINFQEAGKLDPGMKEAAEGQSGCMLLEGEINEALSLMKGSSSVREIAAVFNSSAIIAMRRGDYKQGMDLYEMGLKSVEGDPRLRSRFFFNQGIGYCRWHREKDAISSFSMSWKSDPEFEKARINYLIMAKKLGIKPEAKILSKMSDRNHVDLAVSTPDQIQNMDETIVDPLSPAMDTNADVSSDFDHDFNDDFNDNFDDDNMSF